MLTLYVGVLPVFLFEMVRLEIVAGAERGEATVRCVRSGGSAPAVLLRLSRRRPESEEEMEGL